jgi:hypothetical protein
MKKLVENLNENNFTQDSDDENFQESKIGSSGAKRSSNKRSGLGYSAAQKKGL